MPQKEDQEGNKKVSNRYKSINRRCAHLLKAHRNNENEMESDYIVARF